MFSYPVLTNYSYSYTGSSYTTPNYYYPSYSYEYSYLFLPTLKTEKQDNSSTNLVTGEVLSFEEVLRKMFITVFSNKPFPKYRVLVNSKESKGIIEFALSGYKKDQIQMKVMNDEPDGCNRVFVKIEPPESEDQQSDYVEVCGNIKSAKLAFGFVLPKYVDVEKAEFVDGLLKIYIYRNIPSGKEVEIKVE